MNSFQVIKKYKIVFIPLILLSFGSAIYFNQSKKKIEKSVVRINAAVQFDDEKLYITNNDTCDFVNARITLNENYSVLKTNLMAGETYTIWKIEFRLPDGMKFSPKQIPVKFAIWCDLNAGRKGYYFKKNR